MSDTETPGTTSETRSEAEIVEAPTTFGGIVRRLGPGLIIAGSIVGSGELIATTKTGAQAGITLLWLIVVGCLIKVFVQIELGRYSITHGETTLIALNRVPGPKLKVNWVVWCWLFMMLCTVGQLGGIVGGVGQALAISVPITGDFIDANRVPSEKEISRYLTRDRYLLSEWDLRLRNRWEHATDQERHDALKLHEIEWLTGVLPRTEELLALVSGSRDKLEKQLGALLELEPGTTLGISMFDVPPEAYRQARSQLSTTLDEVNQKLVAKLEAAPDDKTLANLKLLNEAQLTRVLRGHEVLARQFSDLDRENLRGIAAVSAVDERNSREALVDQLKSEGLKSGLLKYDSAKASLDEAKGWVNSSVNPWTMDDRIWAGFVMLLTIGLLWFGRYNMLQNVSVVLVVGFTFITIGNVVSLEWTKQFHISMSQFLDGLSFKIPETTPGEQNPIETALATFGIIGVGATELITYPYWCLEKGYAKFTGPRTEDASWAARARNWLRVMHVDAFLSMIVYTVATLAFFVMGVAVLFKEGRDPEGMRMVSTLAAAYVPVFGAYAGWLFLLGAIAVLYSTFLVANAGNMRMYTDGCKIFGIIDSKNPQSHERSLLFFAVLLPLASFCMYYAGFNPVRLVLIAGMAQGLMLPVIGIGALYFRYRMTDPRLKPSRVWDLLLLLSCLGLLISGGWLIVKELV